MTFAEAKQEFDVRHYLWAGSRWEYEIDQAFPSFQSFKSGSVWSTYHLMRQLSRPQQLALARALLERFHPNAVRYLGENCSVEERSLREMRNAFHAAHGFYNSVVELGQRGLLEEREAALKLLIEVAEPLLSDCDSQDPALAWLHLQTFFGSIPQSRERQLEQRKGRGEKIKYASKRKLRKVMTAKFIESFGERCSGLESVDEEEDLAFRTRCGEWTITTLFWFGRRETLLNYNQAILTEKIDGTPDQVLATLLSFSASLGLTSQTEWEFLVEEDVEAACSAAIKHCGEFFDLAPKLLKGLSPDVTKSY